MRIIRLFLVSCLAGWGLIVSPVISGAQTGTPAVEVTPAVSPLITTTWNRIGLFEGPGVTHYLRGWLNPGVTVTIVERNRVGDWLHVQWRDDEGSVYLDGWGMTGFFNLAETLRFSDLPVDGTIPDGNPETLVGVQLARLAQVPVVPLEISPAMRDVYQLGQERGNFSNVVTKVGDSLSAQDTYLTVMNREHYDLGAYDYLEETLLYFQQQLSPSVAAKIGLNAFAVFDPFWADAALCKPQVTPLECEYQRKMPSVAFILFGPNDVRLETGEVYEGHLRELVEISLDQGIIPVLSTFTAHPEADFFLHALQFNNIIVDVAEDYDLPLINLWLAARGLPEYGLDVDNIHMQLSGFDYLIFSTGHESMYGASLRNLLTLYVLYQLSAALDMP